jgi:Ca2+-binding EF-hand superfamily protein
MVMWVGNNPEFLELLKTNEPSYRIEEPDSVFLNIHKPAEPLIESPKSPIKLMDATVNYLQLRSRTTERQKLATRSRTLRQSQHTPLVKTELRQPAPRIKVRPVPSRRHTTTKHQIDLTKENVLQLKKIFDRIDTDGSGSIDASEFTKGLMSSLSQADSMFNYFDITMSGLITFEEFLIRSCPKITQERLLTMLGWVRERKQQMRMSINTTRLKIARSTKRKVTKNTGRDYKTMFDMYDKNRDGWLDLNEMTDSFINVLSRDRIKELVARHGKNGRVDFESFLSIMLPKEFEIPADLLEEAK